MILEFLLPFGRLNLASLSPEKRDEVVEKCRFVSTEAVEIFEYGKNNDGYWDGAKLHHQVMKKALPIAQVLYPGYSTKRGPTYFGRATIMACRGPKSGMPQA